MLALLALTLAASPDLEAQDLSTWAAKIRPSAEEARFQELDWAPTFLDGVRRAGEEQKPLLFWAMNGHPLGCT